MKLTHELLQHNFEQMAERVRTGKLTAFDMAYVADLYTHDFSFEETPPPLVFPLEPEQQDHIHRLVLEQMVIEQQCLDLMGDA